MIVFFIVATLLREPVEARKPHTMKIEKIDDALEKLQQSRTMVKALPRGQHRAKRGEIRNHEKRLREERQRLVSGETNVLDLWQPKVGDVGEIEAKITARIVAVGDHIAVDLQTMRREYTGDSRILTTSFKYVPQFYLIPAAQARRTLLTGKWHIVKKQKFELKDGAKVHKLEGFVLEPKK